VHLVCDFIDKKICNLKMQKNILSQIASKMDSFLKSHYFEG
jgi:hypothetical protein